MKKWMSKNNVHKGFHLALLFKGSFDIAEVLGGIFMVFLSPDRMERLIAFISKAELMEDPNDLVMNYLVSYSHIFSFSQQHFASFYLLAHGVLKLLMIILLWRKKLFAYPVSIVMFLIFIVVQLQRFTHTHSLLLLALTVVDVFMVILTIMEYRNIKDDMKTIIN